MAHEYKMPEMTLVTSNMQRQGKCGVGGMSERERSYSPINQ